ncbi:MAG TPA: hypothetical protein PLX85_00110 [Dehalococcoidia bacterium]|nr:hypothetical protein [Dehalococcoidia bacterium]
MGSMEAQVAQTLDAQELTVDCPKCSHQITKTLRSLRTHHEMDCPGCRATITLDTDGLNRGYQEALQSAREIDRKLSIPIKLTLKF